MLIRDFDREVLRQQFQSASPYRFVKIENFLDEAFAKEVASSFPTFEGAAGQGKSFNAVNERKKIQVTDAKLFSPPIARLNEALASPEFLADLSYITGLPNLLADEELAGGGVHITGPGGRLDVHVDFNYLEERKLHRRLNLLLYLNPTWDEKWGGQIQLWDKDVKNCCQEFTPALNRCVIFETSDISYHGVRPVAPAAPVPRQSFATYYYTREAPAHWDGNVHSTIFKARPEEKLRGYVLMPAEAVERRVLKDLRRIKRGFKRLIGSAS